MHKRITAAFTALAFALIGLVGFAPNASAATTDCTAWHAATWGKGRICFTEPGTPWPGGTNVQMGVDDLAEDNFCVYLWKNYDTGNGSSGWTRWPDSTRSCGPLNYSYGYDNDGGYKSGWRITRGPTMTNWVTICNDWTGSPGDCPPR